MELTLERVQQLLLQELRDPATSFNRATALYQQARRGTEPWDWTAIDQAIVERFGVVGLESVRSRAAADDPVLLLG